MPDNLARFERLARQAQERGASLRAIQADQAEEARREWELRRSHAEVLSRQTPEFLAGPPDGCGECWEWDLHPTSPLSYSWWHCAAINPEVRMTDLYGDGGDPFEVEFCTHPCHGPDGHPLPLIAYA